MLFNNGGCFTKKGRGLNRYEVWYQRSEDSASFGDVIQHNSSLLKPDLLCHHHVVVLDDVVDFHFVKSPLATLAQGL